MKAKEWAAVSALLFGVLGIGFALESQVGGARRAAPPADVEAFRKTLSLTLAPGARQAAASFDVPHGKRLILEFATASVAASPAQGMSARLQVQGSAEDVLEHRLGLAKGERPGTLLAVQPLRAFADAGTRVTVRLERARLGEAAAGAATLFGYLLEVP